MSRLVRIYGASDDLIEIEDETGELTEEYNSDNWSAVLEAPNGDTAILYVRYQNNGCWTATLGRYDEDYKLPDWGNKISYDDNLCRYSTVLELELPEGTTLTVQE